MAKPVKNLYELVPERSRTFEELEDGTIDVFLPRYGGGPVARILKNFLSKKPVRIRLDDIGASVWRLCDGHRSFREIGEALHGEFGERIAPVYDRLETFLIQMKRAGIIDWKD